MSYKELEVWQKGRVLVVDVYRLSAALPSSEQFGLISQLRRCAVSIPANIAEGYGRRTPGSYDQFLRVAKGSANELETLLILCQDLGYSPSTQPLLTDVAKLGSMLSNLITKVQAGGVHEEQSRYAADDEL